MPLKTTVEIAGRLVGEGQPCYIIAEAGVNHNGELELALQLVDEAAAAGADSVKFQSFHAERVATETAAKAQLQIGLCRLEQKRYAEAATALLIVPFTYDYPELTAVALLEAARALAEDKQRDKAVQLLQRLLRDHPDGEPADAARKRLEELRKG